MLYEKEQSANDCRVQKEGDSMKYLLITVSAVILLTFSIAVCRPADENSGSDHNTASTVAQAEQDLSEPDSTKECTDFTPVSRTTKVQDVIDNPVFEGYGRLLFPVDRTISSDLTLEDVGDILTWYTYVNPDKTVEIVNDLGTRAAAGETVFYDIYTEEEKEEDPQKENTGLSEVTGEEPPTYNCVGTSDGIASYRTMEDRISRIQEQGTDAEIEVFEGLPHGFGLGEGTIAEGWIDHAIAFWEKQMD